LGLSLIFATPSPAAPTYTLPFLALYMRPIIDFLYSSCHVICWWLGQLGGKKALWQLVIRHDG
jgi:hypothetical protein